MLKVNAFVIRGGRTKHGPGRRQWGQSQYAQAAIAALYPFGIPPELVNKRTFKAELVRAVRKHLSQDPAYCARGFGLISRNTILKAVELSN